MHKWLTRYLRCLPRVLLDAAAVLRFRSASVVAPDFGSEGWRTAYGLLAVLNLLTGPRSAVLSPVIAAVVAAVTMVLCWLWGRENDYAARTSYLLMTAGSACQLLAGLAPRAEPIFAVWLGLGFIHTLYLQHH